MEQAIADVPQIAKREKKIENEKSYINTFADCRGNKWSAEEGFPERKNVMSSRNVFPPFTEASYVNLIHFKDEKTKFSLRASYSKRHSEI